LVELAVVIVIVGVLAAFGVPRYRDSVERTKAAEAFNYLSAVRSAQERHLALKGNYAGTVGELDIQQEDPKYFDAPTISKGVYPAGPPDDGAPFWSIALSRKSDTSSYGAYTVAFCEKGYWPSGAPATFYPASTIPETINPVGN